MTCPFKNRYNKYSDYLKDKFGEKVYKVSVDAGFTCPTRNGTISTGGCIYCNNSSFSPGNRSAADIDQQIENGIHRLKKRNINKYLVYFQSYTNTYAPIENLEKIYKKALQYDGVVGVSIGTRPDCIDEKVLALLDEINADTYVSVEIGIESIYDKTLQWANRGHDYQITKNTIAKLKTRDLHVCGHYILGFPTESRAEMLASTAELNRLGIDALKLHHLHIVKNTKLAKIYKNKRFRLFSEEEWINFVVEYLQHLKSEIVIQRLMGDAQGDTLIAPKWEMNKFQILSSIKNKLIEQDAYQGSKLK